MSSDSTYAGIMVFEAIRRTLRQGHVISLKSLRFLRREYESRPMFDLYFLENSRVVHDYVHSTDDTQLYDFDHVTFDTRGLVEFEHTRTKTVYTLDLRDENNVMLLVMCKERRFIDPLARALRHHDLTQLPRLVNESSIPAVGMRHEMDSFIKELSLLVTPQADVTVQYVELDIGVSTD